MGAYISDGGPLSFRSDTELALERATPRTLSESLLREGLLLHLGSRSASVLSADPGEAVLHGEVYRRLGELVQQEVPGSVAPLLQQTLAVLGSGRLPGGGEVPEDLWLEYLQNEDSRIRLAAGLAYSRAREFPAEPVRAEAPAAPTAPAPGGCRSWLRRLLGPR